jgi:hypothetical protein
VIVGLSAIRYLLDSAIIAAGNRQGNNVEVQVDGDINNN